MPFKATDTYVAHYWTCAATLVAGGLCRPDLTGKDLLQQRTAVAQAVGALALALVTVAVNAGELEIEP